MATLASTAIKDTYPLLLKIESGGIDGTLRKVEDGDGTDSSLLISTTAIAIDATDKLYLDAGSDTYIHEVSADKMDFVVGNQTILELTEGGGGASDSLAIQALNKLFLDGGGTTYIQESADGVVDFYADNVQMLQLLEGGTDYVWIPVDATKLAIGAGKDLNIYTSSDDAYIENITSDKDIIFKVNDGGAATEVMRIDGSLSNVAIGGNTGSATSSLVVRTDADILTATNNLLHVLDNHATVDTADVLARFDFSADADVDGARAISFHDSGGEIGSITLDGNATAFNTSSDYRLKTDLKDIVDATGTINKLKLYDFAWKKNTSKRLTGVIAHEAAEIVPYAIRGEKDAMTVNDDGESVIDAQGADYSKFVPLLLKSIQELSESNDALKKRIEVLEAA
tara:strand:+ start:41 stop:1231 length:1191 start_codon:yes stop_codon:yes gene_type:complete